MELGAETIVPIMLDPKDVSPSKGRYRRLDDILFRTLTIMLDETGKNDLQLANTVNLGTRARRDVMRVLACRPRLRNRVQAVFGKGEYRDLFGEEKKLVHLVKGLRPDMELTADPLKFDPQKMRQWMDLGEQKALCVVTVCPF